MSDKSAPLIITCQLDEKAQNFFNLMRKKYFPPERNFLDAHLTLFHHLPAGENRIADAIKLAVSRPRFELQVTAVANIGNGVAYKLESEQLQQIHAQLQQQWQHWLTPQDRQKLWPHITIQNKVAPLKARELQVELIQVFEVFSITATGLALWEYHGGPWAYVETFEFA